MVHLVSKKTRIAVLIFDLDIQALFGLRDAGFSIARIDSSFPGHIGRGRIFCR
jgi:hypothetical protein